MAREAPFNGPHDPDRYMYTKVDVPLDSKTLMMWRQLAESGRLGRKPEGPPCGEVALAVVIQTGKPISKIMDRRLEGPKSQFEQQH